MMDIVGIPSAIGVFDFMLFMNTLEVMLMMFSNDAK